MTRKLTFTLVALGFSVPAAAQSLAPSYAIPGSNDRAYPYVQLCPGLNNTVQVCPAGGGGGGGNAAAGTTGALPPAAASYEAFVNAGGNLTGVSPSNPFPVTFPGGVSVSNFPATQAISGTIGVSSLPSLPAGANAIGAVTVSGTVSVSSIPALPAGANAIGSVSVSNLPATQPVSGTVGVGGTLPGFASVPSVAVGNFPASGVSAVTGTFTGTGTSVAFTPLAGRAFNFSIISASTAPGASLNGTVYLARSIDGGTTYTPVTASGTQLESFTTVTGESWSDSQTGASYELICSVYTSGTITYRISQ